MNQSALIDQQLDRLLDNHVVEPNKAYVDRGRELVLLHARTVFPQRVSLWKRVIAPLFFAGVSVASLVIIVGQIQRSRMSEIDRIQDDLNHLTIQDE